MQTDLIGDELRIAGPRSRLLTRSREPTVAASVRQAARGISRDLGALAGRPPEPRARSTTSQQSS